MKEEDKKAVQAACFGINFVLSSWLIVETISLFYSREYANAVFCSISAIANGFTAFMLWRIR